MKSPKIVAMLSVLSVIAGVSLFVFHPTENTAQEMISANELKFIRFTGVVLVLIGFYFVHVLLPAPKTKRKK